MPAAIAKPPTLYCPMFSTFLRNALDTRRARLFWRLTLLLLLIAISYLALAPAPPKGVGSGWDKLNHAMAFASLAFCGHWSLSSGRQRWLALPLALLAYGAVIELLQLQIPGRQGEWIDLFADAVGATLGLCAAGALGTLRRD
ncbi:MAG: VanZ family protein [Paucibacter sp.]|nr:VanZ family protein [Roseateles sp.]